MEGLNAILNFAAKYSWRSLVGVFVATGTVLFFSTRLGIYEWALPLRGWLIFAFIFSGAVLVTYPCSAIYRAMAVGLRGVMAILLNRIQLHYLTASEKPLCRQFVDTDGTPMLHNPTDGAISSLVRKGILLPAILPLPGGMFNYNMRTWALEYLRGHPELLK